MTNKTPSADLIEAIRLVRAGTGEHYYMWNLSGPANVKLRAKIMGYLLGERTPQAKAGINALVAELYRQCGITDDYQADRDRNFAVYAKGVLGNQEILNALAEDPIQPFQLICDHRDYRNGFWLCPICEEAYSTIELAQECLEGHGR